MYLLRRYFGVSAHDALNVIPEWEINNMLNHLARDLRKAE